jgi:RNA polymerase sigma-70 factor, ECF subfamily
VELRSHEGPQIFARIQSPGDGVLLARLQAGDLGSFETIVRRYGGCLLGAARRLLGNEADAQDAVQDAFSSAFNSIAGFRGDASISTWLHRIVVNAALMQLRRRRRCSEVAIEDLSPRFSVDMPGARADMPAVGGAEHWTEVRETRDRVRRCIDQLPAHYRSVLLMRDIEELTTSEVAARLSLNPNTVKVRLHRARQALKGLLDREGLKRGRQVGQPDFTRCRFAKVTGQIVAVAR